MIFHRGCKGDIDPFPHFFKHFSVLSRQSEIETVQIIIISYKNGCQIILLLRTDARNVLKPSHLYIYIYIKVLKTSASFLLFFITTSMYPYSKAVVVESDQNN